MTVLIFALVYCTAALLLDVRFSNKFFIRECTLMAVGGAAFALASMLIEMIN